MFTNTRPLNILAVVAHHDDLELGCGGTFSLLRSKGHNLFGIVMTHSGYSNAQGEIVRTPTVARQEGQRAADALGYKLTSLEEDTLDIQVSDKNVCVILDHIKEHKIDAIFTHWHGDTHPPHIAVNRMVLHAARNVSTVLGFEVNWHLGVSQFSPNFFVPLSDTDWKNKINAYKLFESEVSRAGDKYLRFHDCETQRYGLQVGRERAEGFYAYKFSLVL